MRRAGCVASIALAAGALGGAQAVGWAVESADESAPAVAPRAAASGRAGRGPVDPAAWVTVWVDLDLPALAAHPRTRGAERDALRARIVAQQDAVMRQLRALGAQEQARIQQVRNALAVRIERSRLDAARAVPGVRALRAVRDVDRPPPLPDR